MAATHRVSTRGLATSSAAAHGPSAARADPSAAPTNPSASPRPPESESVSRHHLGRPAGRALHPWAWWAWAIGVAVVASLSTNPLFLITLAAVVVAVVLLRRGDSPWARAIWAYVVLAGIVVLIRVLFTVLLGSGGGTTVLFELPRIPLPDWAVGVQLGGPVMAERLLATAADGLRLGVMLIAVGAANALANPKRALRTVPSALYDVSVAVVIAMTVAPQLVQSTIRVRRARRLRGGRTSGLRAVRAIAIPVLEDAVDRSLALAAAMEARGYGRTSLAGAPRHRLAGSLLTGGLVLLCLGIYLLLSGQGSTGWAVASLVAGACAAAGGLAVTGQRLRVTRYRPDRWLWQEWVVLGCGVLVAFGAVLWAQADPAALMPPTSPLAWPDLPRGYLALLAVVAVPSLVAPTPPAGTTTAPWQLAR